MLWNKTRYIIKLRGGHGQMATDGMFGLIHHMIVNPESSDTIWSMQIKDRDNDVIYEILDHEGRLDQHPDLSIGQDKQERLMLRIFDSTCNEKVTVIFKVKEKT